MMVTIDAEGTIVGSLPSHKDDREGEVDKEGLECGESERGHDGEGMRWGDLRGMRGKGLPAALALNESIR